MIILPDRNIPRARLLKPMAAREWRTPSQAQWKNLFGHENQTRFNVTARHLGHIVWRGWFDDRADFDAFAFALVAGSLPFERALWDLPAPAWRPYIGDGVPLEYEFITTVFIVSGTTYSVPADCSGITGLTGEFIDCIGGGGSGSADWNNSFAHSGAGGGGAAWGQIVSLALTPSSSVDIRVGAGGAQASSTTSGAAVNGNAGTFTGFNGTTLAGCSVSADFGRGGVSQNGGGAGAAGSSTNGVGTTKQSGGRGGQKPSGGESQGGAKGGGGSAGPNGAGVQGVDNNGSGTVTNGGAGGGTNPGAAGTATNAGPNTGNNGGNGSAYDATHGAGGGSGGHMLNTANGGVTVQGGAAGNYGAGSGSSRGRSADEGGDPLAAVKSGVGGPGLIVVAYTPVVPTIGLRFAAPIAGLA